MKHEYMETWSGDEDALLLNLIDRHGTSWKAIGKRMPNRSVASMRNRYQRIIKGRQVGGKNRCLKCGQIKRGHSCGRRNDDDVVSIASSGSTDDVLLVSPVRSDNANNEITCADDSEVETCEEEEMQDEETCGEVENDDPVSFPEHLFCWSTVQTAHDMGFEGVTHPPPLLQRFPFLTSLPC